MSEHTTTDPHEPVDLIGDIVAYEAGDLSMLQALELFGYLIRSGTVHHLQGTYGRTAQALVDGGLLEPETGNLTDVAVNRLAQIPEED